MGNSLCRVRAPEPEPVHPHVHGELRARRGHLRSGRGSSPRAWGTRIPGTGGRPIGRFIPTCMGNSSWQQHGPAPSPVHPHVHGELPDTGRRGTHESGSSPRAWGTPSRPRLTHMQCRFIPTCMGNSMQGSQWVVTSTVHPHVHGELSCAHTD